MDNFRKASVYGLLLLLIIAVATTFSDLPQLTTPHLRSLYLWTKVPILILALVSAFWLHKDNSSPLANTMAGIVMISYSIQGQFFFPFYVFAFCALIIFYSFVFPVSKTIFRVIAIFGVVISIRLFYLRWEVFVAQMQQPKFSDFIIVMAAFGMIAFVSNSFFTTERYFREESILKFAKVGLQTSRVIHDLKGLSASPINNLKLIESKLPLTVRKEVDEVLGLLMRDLEGFKKVLFELNQLSSSKLLEIDNFSTEEVFSSVLIILKKQLSGIDLHVSGSLRLKTDKNLLTSIFLNIFINSIEAFKERCIEKGEIRVTVQEKTILFYDNANGFDKKVLKKLSMGQFISTRASGSGLGLLFVFDGMSKIGGSSRAFNNELGACVELRFPEAGIVHKMKYDA